MKLLLDTHTLLWAESQPAQLSAIAAPALADPSNELFLSPAVYWEIAIKVNLQKLTLAKPFADFLQQAIANLTLQPLPISIAHAAALIGMPQHHRDPFDRLLIAQAITENMTVVSADQVFDAYGATRLW